MGVGLNSSRLLLREEVRLVVGLSGGGGDWWGEGGGGGGGRGMAEKSGMGDQIKRGMEWGCNYFQPIQHGLLLCMIQKIIHTVVCWVWLAPFSTAYLLVFSVHHIMLHLKTKTKNFYNALAFAKGAFRGQLTCM